MYKKILLPLLLIILSSSVFALQVYHDVPKFQNITNNYYNYTVNDTAFNSTQFDTSSTISTKENWLTSFINSWFGTKDTDDLDEGSSNKYDNQSWDEGYANDKYVNVNGDNMTGNLNINANLTANKYSMYSNTSIGICSNSSGDVFFGYIDGAC
jgi:hypothetical protein